MDFRRWLVVALCFCVFSGCKTCQSVYDYCGPMPDEGGDFLYRKNSVLGGDPTMKRMGDVPPEAPAEEEETGPQPTPADEEPRPDMEMEGDRPTMAPDESADERVYDELEEVADDESDRDLDGESESDLDDSDSDDGEVAGSEPSASGLDWHAPQKKSPPPIRQVQFREE